ncbi:hypothetical protein [Thalassomonas sp. M1454]|uniref:hypothetical protein n=1 Tax=Thalassomonas sp. M1454 TaxID=2594477 RepID=UPI00117CFF83|nr:hypothetical protein [Thalassomonas sp. M1454]TRX57959.1 hypothetical protein FNN08_00805 [Thalassomonas sp. M1454]
MLLKEFDLDIPSLDKVERFDFANQIRCISSHYERYFHKRFHTPNFWKILVECHDEESDEQNTYLGVRVVKVRFDYEKYLNSSESERKKQALASLHYGALKVAQHFDFDLELFNFCNDSVVSDEYENQWIWKKPKSNKPRTHKVQVLCQHEMKSFVAELQVLNKSGDVVSRETAFISEPNEFAFAANFGELKWLSENQAAFYSKSRNLLASISI